MIGGARRWLKRNRKGLAIGAGVLGAGYLAGQYVISKISEARERMSSDRIAKENLRRRFEQNQTDCAYTVIALLPTATENIVDALPVEELTKELQKKRAERLARLNAGEATGSDMSSVSPSLPGDDTKSLSSFQSEGYVHTSQLGEPADSDGQPRVKRNKTQLWNEVKITSVTRSFTMIYILSLLNIFTRIQLNLLGRRNYLSSVISLANPPADSTISLEDHDYDLTQTLGDDIATNRRYLAFSWWLLHRGWKTLMERVQPAVEEAFGPLNPREDISLSKLSELTLQIRRKIEGNTEEDRRSKKWLSCLLPPTEDEDYVLRESGVEGVADPSSSETASKLRLLLDETADLIDSPSFSFVLTLLLNEGFSTLVDVKCANEAFKASTPAPETAPQSFDSMATVIPPVVSERKTKLANLLAVMARQAHVIGQGPMGPNDYLDVMDKNVRELEAFSAVIYSSNFDLELPGASRQPGASKGMDSMDPNSSAMFSEVVVDETEAGSVDLAQSAPVLIDQEERVIEIAEETNEAPVAEETTPVPSKEPTSESAFDRAWGKAVDEGNTASGPEVQETS
ncbi:Peroxin-3 [Penicillium longicatenatum]|uniref:Peroxin-3 n=1 Tax=Penicillium longicatenatum TaxID=1561947 RepID=UPI002549A3DF|nr:Peroxin-3 [Penicillium longicatenatum]KAJ5649945.1 Peroxin-3 [Penicillium longicatenatum]